MNNHHSKREKSHRKSLFLNNSYLLFVVLNAIFIVVGFQGYSQEHVNKIEIKVYPFLCIPLSD